MAFRLACAACASACIAAGAHAGEMSAGAGAEVLHKAGMPMVSFELRPVSLLAWRNGNYGVGLAYAFGPRVGWNASVGGILARRTDDDLGTRPNVLLRGSYCGIQLCLSYAHISHGSGLGIRKHSANSGLNFLFVEYRYRFP